MSKKSSRPEWHEPVEAIGETLDDPIEDTIEVGTVTLVDGPIDPVPLTEGTRGPEDYTAPRSSAGPMPDLSFAADETPVNETVTDSAPEDKAKNAAETENAAETVADKAETLKSTVKSTVGDAGSKTKNVLGGAVGKIGSAGAAGAQGAGTALWALVQRNPLQALLVFSSLVWLIRHNKAASSQVPVSISDAANDAAAKAGSVIGQVQATAGTLGAQVQEQAHRGTNWFSRTLQDKPLAIGAMAIVFGAGLGFAVPETAYEHRLLGEAHDSLADKAQAAAQDLTQKVQTVAQTAVQEAIDTVKEEAKNQGLTS